MEEPKKSSPAHRAPHDNSMAASIAVGFDGITEIWGWFEIDEENM
jgi:hypothetical protein